MQNSLFRTSAIEHQKSRLHGEVLVIPSAKHSLVALLLVLWVVTTIAWMANSQYARQETVAGYLEPPAGVIKVYSQANAGRVAQVQVFEGETVNKGQTLLVIDQDRAMTNGSTLESTLLQEHHRQRALLQEQVSRNQSLHQIAMSNLKLRIEAAKQDLQALDSQIATLGDRQALMSSRIENVQNVRAKGHLTQTDLDILLEQKLAQQSELQGLQREKINRHNQLQLLNSEVVTLPQNHLDDERVLQTKLSELSLSIAQIDGQRSYIIKASRDGVVSNLQAKVGQQIANQTPLLSIVPNDSEINAKLLIPVRAAGFVEKGQQIDIRYDAFPYQKFGLYTGVIERVSDAVILPNELQSSPIPIQEPVYLVHAKLDSQSVSAYGKPLQLKSGMTLSADITLSDRSLIEWLLEPLLSLRGGL